MLMHRKSLGILSTTDSTDSASLFCLASRPALQHEPALTHSGAHLQASGRTYHTRYHLLIKSNDHSHKQAHADGTAIRRNLGFGISLQMQTSGARYQTTD